MRKETAQWQDTLRYFARILAHPELRARALAVVVSMTPARIQMTRITSGRHVRFLEDDLSQAERWLLQRSAEAAGAAPDEPRSWIIPMPSRERSLDSRRDSAHG